MIRYYFAALAFWLVLCAPAPAQQGQGFQYLNITTSTTTLVKSGAGAVHTVCVNTKGAAASVTQVFDSLTAAGTKIGTIDSLNQVGCYLWDAAFTIGLTVVTTGAPDVTVSYR